MPAMTAADMEYREFLCDRVMLVQEASGIGKRRFANSIGVSASLLSNYAAYRSSPSHAVLSAICATYGIPPGFFFHRKAQTTGNSQLVRKAWALAQAQAKRAAKAA